MARFSPTAIRELRHKTGMTQQEFAKRLGVINVTVSRWENGAFAPDKRAQDDLADLARAYQHGEPLLLPERAYDPVRPIMRATHHDPERVLVALSAEQISTLLDALLEGEELEPIREKVVRQAYDELAAAYLDLTGEAHHAVRIVVDTTVTA